jgi:hypothetical protein
MMMHLRILLQAVLQFASGYINRPSGNNIEIIEEVIIDNLRSQLYSSVL